MRGFTLIEAMIVITLMSIISVVVIPMSFSLYQRQTLDEAHTSVLEAMRTAQSHARAQKNGSDHGIRFLDSTYVLFEGTTYETRVIQNDVVVTFPDSITIDAPTEIVFSQYFGQPSTTSPITITRGDDEASISVLTSGFVH